MDENSKHCQQTGDLTIFEVTAFKDSLVEMLPCGGTGRLDLSPVWQVAAERYNSSCRIADRTPLRDRRLDETTHQLERIGGCLIAARG